MKSGGPAAASFISKRADGIHLAPFEQGEIGPDLFRHACLMGLEGLVSKHSDSFYRGGRSDRWVKVKNRQHPAFSRVMDQVALFSIEKHDVGDHSDAEKILAIQAHSMEI